MAKPISGTALAAAALSLGLIFFGGPVGPGNGAAIAADASQLRLAQGSPRNAPPGAAAPQRAPAGVTGDADRQLDELQKKLAITPAQKPQFDAFAQVVRQNAQSMEAALQQAQQNPTHNALEDLRTAARVTEAQADGLKRLVPVFQSLYEALNEQQKRTADQVLGQDQGGQGGAPPAPRRKG
jgi:protein CpxP